MAQWPGGRGPGLCAGAIAQPGIEGNDTGGIREQRVDVELADLRLIGGELAEPDQDLDDRVDIRRWLATVTLQELPYPRARHQPARKQCIQRRQLKGGVTHNLDCRASLAECHQRPEDRIFESPTRSSMAPWRRTIG